MRADSFFAEKFGSRTRAKDALLRGLVLRAGSIERDYAGRSAAEFLSAGSIRVALPNVLGARRRAATPESGTPTGRR